MSADDVMKAVDGYCNRLWKALHKLPGAEREEIVREVRSHIVERVEAESKVTEQVLTEILEAVGDPKALASEYKAQAVLRQATHSRSPWVLLRATLHWATTSVVGVVALLAAVIGYGCGTVFFLSGFLKPIFPSRIGLWLAPQRTLCFGYWNGHLSGTALYGISVRPPADFVLGTLGPTDGPVRELLGAWLSPVAVFCGVLCLLGTSLVARWFIAKFKPKSKRCASFPYAVSDSNPDSKHQSGIRQAVI